MLLRGLMSWMEFGTGLAHFASTSGAVFCHVNCGSRKRGIVAATVGMLTSVMWKYSVQSYEIIREVGR